MSKRVFITRVHKASLVLIWPFDTNGHRCISTMFTKNRDVMVNVAASVSRPTATAGPPTAASSSAAAHGPPFAFHLTESRLDLDRCSGCRSSASQPPLPRVFPTDDSLECEGAGLSRFSARSGQMMRSPVAPCAAPRAESKGDIPFHEGEFVPLRCPYTSILVSDVTAALFGPVSGGKGIPSRPSPAAITSPDTLAEHPLVLVASVRHRPSLWTLSPLQPLPLRGGEHGQSHPRRLRDQWRAAKIKVEGCPLFLRRLRMHIHGLGCQSVRRSIGPDISTRALVEMFAVGSVSFHPRDLHCSGPVSQPRVAVQDDASILFGWIQGDACWRIGGADHVRTVAAEVCTPHHLPPCHRHTDVLSRLGRLW